MMSLAGDECRKELENLRARRDRLKRLLSRQIAGLKQELSDGNKAAVKVSISLLSDTRDQVFELDGKHDDICATETDYDTEIDAQQALKKTIGVAIEEATAWVETEEATAVAVNGNGCVAPANASVSVSSHGRFERVFRLPELQLPRFNGDILQFQTWFDAFQDMVGSHENMPKSFKFRHLQACLTGEAARTIAGMSATNDSYDDAIQLITARFGKKSRRIQAHMDALLCMEKVTRPEAKELRRLYDDLEIYVRGLRSLGVTSERYGVVLAPVLLFCLPKIVRLEWSKTPESDKDEISLEELMSFIRSQVEARERCALLEERDKIAERKPDNFQSKGKRDSAKHDSFRREYSSDSRPRSFGTANALQTSAISGRGSKCVFCRLGHASHSCRNASKMSELELTRKLREAGACFVCFECGHMSGVCKEQCRICSGRHHEWLCRRKSSHSSSHGGSGNCVPASDDNPSSGSANQNEVKALSSATDSPSGALLQIASAQALGKNGPLPVRILFDGGSEKSFISSALAKKAEFPLSHSEKLSVTGFGGKRDETSAKRVYNVTLVGSDGDKIGIKAVEVPVICAPLRKIGVPFVRCLAEFKDLQFSEKFDDCEEVEIQVLIGADEYWSFFDGQIRKSRDSGLVAMKSRFGWVLNGKVDNGISTSMSTSLLVSVQPDVLMRSLWELEGIGVHQDKDLPLPDPILDEIQSRIRFDGKRYSVPLPWKKGSFGELPSNLESSRKRLKSLLKRFSSDPRLSNDYRRVIDELEEGGIVEEVPQSELTCEEASYIPHRPVLKESSTSTPVRAIFDASCKERGVSLNDLLEAGPSLLPDLTAIFIRFRSWPVALCADARKAFYQVAVHKEDRDALRFLWSDADGNERHMRFCRLVMGLTSSPFLLNAVVKFHLDQQERSPVVEDLGRNLFVDDWVTGHETSELAVEAAVAAKEILSRAGLELTKWKSNKLEVLTSLNQVAADGCEEKTECVLGMGWCLSSDSITFPRQVGTSFPVVLTKRQFLGIVASLYDPAGFLSPFILLAKVLLQETWLLGLEWEHELPTSLSESAQNWVAELKNLSMVKVSRSYFDQSIEKLIRTGADLSLHTFVDASERGYGAVCFLRCVFADSVGVAWVMSKSRVAPLKRQSIPRLELLGAVVGVRLSTFVAESLNLPSSVKRFWILGGRRSLKSILNCCLKCRCLTGKSFDPPSAPLPRDCVSLSSVLRVCDGLFWSAVLERWLYVLCTVRVVELLRGRDESVRVVRVESPRGTLLRPARKLYPLEMPSREPEEDQDADAGKGTCPSPRSTDHDPQKFEDPTSSKGAGCCGRPARKRRLPARYHE